MIDSKISIATVYRTVKLFEEAGILAKHDFKGGKARYEEMSESHHDHLIDVESELLDVNVNYHSSRKDMILNYFNIMALEGSLVATFENYLPDYN